MHPLAQAVREIPDFPKQGISFKDITPILSDPDTFKQSIFEFRRLCEHQTFDKIAVIDARGFLFGSALAYEMGLGLIPIRKKGKLPYETIASSYQLEYGEATLEMHTDAVQLGDRVLLLDDLLATGGSARASIHLLQQLGATVPLAIFLIELRFLQGAKSLSPTETRSLIVYEEAD